MSDTELRAALAQSQAGTIYLNGLDWAYRHGGNRDNMYRFAGEFLDTVAFDPDSQMGGRDRPEVFAAAHTGTYPYVLDATADAALHADKRDACVDLLRSARLSRGEIAATLGLAPVTVDLLLNTWEQHGEHAVTVDVGPELINWCESNASHGDFVFLTAADASLEGYGVTVIDDRRWWGAILRELHHHNQTSTGPVFLVVDFELIFRDERGGDSVETLLEALRQLTHAPAPAAVRVLLIGGARADAARELLNGASS